MASSRAGRWPISAVMPRPLRASAMDWLIFPAQRAAVASVRAGNVGHGTGSAPVCPTVPGGNGGRATQFLWRLKIDAIKIRLLLTARRCLTARFAARYFRNCRHFTGAVSQPPVTPRTAIYQHYAFSQPPSPYSTVPPARPSPFRCVAVCSLCVPHRPCWRKQ